MNDRKIWIFSACVECATLGLLAVVWFAGGHSPIIAILAAAIVFQLVRSWKHLEWRR